MYATYTSSKKRERKSGRIGYRRCCVLLAACCLISFAKLTQQRDDRLLFPGCGCIVLQRSLMDHL